MAGGTGRRLEVLNSIISIISCLCLDLPDRPHPSHQNTRDAVMMAFAPAFLLVLLQISLGKTTPPNANLAKLLTHTKLHHQRLDLLKTLHLRLQQQDGQPLRVERIKYDPHFDAKQFHQSYERTSTPVVIESPTIQYWSTPAPSNATQWDVQWFKEYCGDGLARIRVGDTNTNLPLLDWTMYTVKLSHYIDFVQGVLPQLDLLHEKHQHAFTVTDPDVTYLFDWPLSQCPSHVLDQFILPRYFANDLLTLCNDCPYNENDWPSLFIGTSKMQSSQLHRDTFGSAFFSIQLVGSKIWRIYDSNDVAFLYPSLRDDVHFDLTDVYSKEQQTKYPLLKFARYVDIQVNPGELLYVPAGLPHQVIPVNDNKSNITVMLGMNFVSVGNVQHVIEATRPKPLLEDFSASSSSTSVTPTFFTQKKYEVLHVFFQTYEQEFAKIIDWDIQHQEWRTWKRRKLQITNLENNGGGG
jgi:hypothetical protein